MADRVGVVELLGLLAAVPVLFGVAFGLVDHSRLVGFGQPSRAVMRMDFYPSGGGVFRGGIEDAVGVDVEANLDLRHAARSRWAASRLNCPRLVLPGWRRCWPRTTSGQPLSAGRPNSCSKIAATAGMRVPPDEHESIDLGRCRFRVAWRPLDRATAPFDHRPEQMFQLGAGQIPADTAGL